MDLPDKLTKEQILPIFNIIISDKNKRITYQFKDSSVIAKTIELTVTNGVGYTTPSEKSGKNILKKELMNYLRDFDELVEKNKYDFMKERLAETIINLDSCFSLLNTSVNNANKLEKLYYDCLDQIKDHNEYMKKTFPSSMLTTLENTKEKSKEDFKKKGFLEKFFS